MNDLKEQHDIMFDALSLYGKVHLQMLFQENPGYDDAGVQFLTFFVNLYRGCNITLKSIN